MPVREVITSESFNRQQQMNNSAAVFCKKHDPSCFNFMDIETAQPRVNTVQKTPTPLPQRGFWFNPHPSRNSSLAAHSPLQHFVSIH